MSPSTKSSAASPTSPPAGGASSRGGRTVTVELQREGTLASGAGPAIMVIVGGLMAYDLGTVGVWVGCFLIALGAYRLVRLGLSLRHPPGAIVVTADEVELPRGLAVPGPLKVAPADVTAVYFLRRAVPWNRSAPVLVVEVGPRALAFPRDWFASEADQRHAVHALIQGSPALRAHAGATVPPGGEAASAAKPDDDVAP
jgi:hypothetical protein